MKQCKIPKSKNRLKQVWRKMMSRCYNPKDDYYYKYGGRGIKVCDDWHTFETFRDWAMKTGYDENAPYMQCQLDRIDNNKGYCPENCRWTNAHVQRMNQGIAKTNTSGYKCISYHSLCKKWRILLTIGGKKQKHIGFYLTKKEAVDAYNKYIIDNNLTEYKIQEWKG